MASGDLADFAAITGAADVASHYLEQADGNLEEALNMYFRACSDAETPTSPTSPSSPFPADLRVGSGGRRLGGASTGGSRLLQHELLTELCMEGVRRLSKDLAALQKASDRLAWDMEVTMRDDRLDLWVLRWFFDVDTPIGQDLHQYGVMNCIEKPCVELLVKFPNEFPNYPPTIRLVLPRFEYLTGSVTFGGLLCDETLSTTNWRPDTDLETLFLTLKQRMESSGARLALRTVRPYEDGTLQDDLGRLNSGTLPTMNQFRDRLYAFSFGYARDHMMGYTPTALGLDAGNRLIMPGNTAQQIYSCPNLRLPLLFEVKAANGRRAYCGIQDFSGDVPSTVLIPSWMRDDLFMKEGDSVELRCVNLPLCTFCKFQPHSLDFYDLPDPKVILQREVRHFAALTQGISIPIQHDGKTYLLEVLELKPGPAVSLCSENPDEVIEVTLDFVPAPDFEDPQDQQARLALIQGRRAEREAKEKREAEEIVERERQAKIAEVNRYKDAIRSQLPPEPAATAEAVMLALKFPNGARVTRWFPRSGRVLHLVWYAMLMETPWQGSPTTSAHSYVVSLAYPSRVLHSGESLDTIPNRSVVVVHENVDDTPSVGWDEEEW